MPSDVTRLLLIEDYENDVQLIKALLDRNRYRIHSVPTLRRGLDELSRNHFDAILLDLGLPDCSGLETLKRVRQHDSQTPLVILTGLENQDAALEALTHGAQDYLFKSEFSQWTLSRSVDYAIGRAIFARETLAQKQRAQQYLDLLGTLAVVLTTDGHVRKINKAGRSFLGFSEDQIVGKNWIDTVVDTPHRHKVRDYLRQGYFYEKNSTHLPVYRYDIRDAGQRRHEMNWSIAPLVNDGKRSGLVCIGQDVSDLHKTEQYTQQHDKLAALGEVAGAIAHDINNMLFPIKALTEMSCRDFPDDTPVKRRMKKVLDATDQAHALCERILTVSHKDPPEQTFCGIDRVIDEAAGLMRVGLSKSVVCTVELDNDLPCLKADPGQISTLLMNVIKNAADAMAEDGGQITVSASTQTIDSSETRVKIPPGDYLVIAIRDTGPGMTDEVKSRLFEPYFTTKPKGKGTGLGMATVHGIMMRHGGAIQVNSRLGTGTEFSFYFPVSHESDSARPDSPRPETGPTLN